MSSSYTPSPAAIENAFILGFTIVEEYCKLLRLPVDIINAAKDIYQLSKPLDYLRSKSMRALATACIFCACKQELRVIHLAWMCDEMQGDMRQSLEMLWVIEHLVHNAAPKAPPPAVTYELSFPEHRDSCTIDGRAKKIVLSWPGVEDFVLWGKYSTAHPGLRDFHEGQALKWIDDALEEPTMRLHEARGNEVVQPLVEPQLPAEEELMMDKYEKTEVQQAKDSALFYNAEQCEEAEQVVGDSCEISDEYVSAESR